LADFESQGIRSVTHLVLVLGAFIKKLPGAHPATGGTRKHSVPGRVHSVTKELRFVNPKLTSNPFLTHGTVESPLKPHRRLN
jgi:hypothetical protein